MAPLLPRGPPKLIGPTWWCPVKYETTEESLADYHVQNDGRLYVPIDEAENWCIEDAPPQYGYARVLDEGFYAFVRRVRRPRLGAQAWLLCQEGVETSVVAGPFSTRVPDAAVIRAIQSTDHDDLFLQANLEHGKLSITHFSGGQMEALRRRAHPES